MALLTWTVRYARLIMDKATSRMAKQSEGDTVKRRQDYHIHGRSQPKLVIYGLKRRFNSCLHGPQGTPCGPRNHYLEVRLPPSEVFVEQTSPWRFELILQQQMLNPNTGKLIIYKPDRT